MVRLPGMRSTVLTLPEGVTANSARLMPLSLAVNQTSSPLGDHANPTKSDQSAGVAQHWVLDERDLFSVRGHSYIVEPTGRFIEDFADRVLQAIAGARVTRDGQTASVRRPACALHVIQDFARRAPGNRHARQHHPACPACQGAPVFQD